MRPTIEDQFANVYEIDERGVLQLPPIWRREDAKALKNRADEARCSNCHTSLETDKRSFVPELRADVETKTYKLKQKQDELDALRAEHTRLKAEHVRLKAELGESLKRSQP